MLKVYVDCVVRLLLLMSLITWKIASLPRLNSLFHCCSELSVKYC